MSDMKRCIPVSDARLRAVCKEKGISISKLGVMAGHGAGFFHNKLKRNTFTSLDIGFLASLGIVYEDIKPICDKHIEESCSSLTKEELEDVLADFLVEIHKMQEELIKEMQELWKK